MACMASSWLKPAPGDQRQASIRRFFHFRFAINNGYTQERSEYRKGKLRRLALGAADAPAEGRCALYLIDETCAGRFFQRLRQRPILRAVGSADRSDSAQMIFRLIAVTLLDLPQS